MTDTETGRDLRRYLLGRLPEPESDALEVGLLADGDAFDAMQAAEDDLIDDYARGALGPADREAFEANFLPRGGMAGRVAFARGLGTAVAEHPAPAARPWSERLAGWLGGLMPAPALRLAAAAAVLVLAVAAGWSAWQTAELRRQVADLEASQGELAGERAELARRESALRDELAAAHRTAAELARGEGTGGELVAAARRIEELEGEVQSLRRLPPPRRGEVAVSFLLALATRGSGVPELAVPAAADTVTLQLQTLDAGFYDRFQVRVAGPGGVEAWSRGGLAAAAGTVDVERPAAVLAPGRHAVRLEGRDAGAAELVGAYPIDIRRP